MMSTKTGRASQRLVTTRSILSDNVRLEAVAFFVKHPARIRSM